MLADYAQALETKGLAANMLYTPPSEAQEQLEALVKRRSQLVDIRAAEKNRLEQIHDSQRQSVTDLIAPLDKLIADSEQDIDQKQQRLRRRHIGQKKVLKIAVSLMLQGFKRGQNL